MLKESFASFLLFYTFCLFFPDKITVLPQWPDTIARNIYGLLGHRDVRPPFNSTTNYKNQERLWQKTRIEVVCCYVSHHPTVLSPLSRLWCDNGKLAYFLVNSSCLYVISCYFISRITHAFRFNLMSQAEYIVLCGVSHLVIYFIWGITRVWCFISRITLVVDSNLLCHTLSLVASLFKFWRLGSALVTKHVWCLR